ncbi:MAG: DUF4838 domain-containing protein [Bacilli bacterium]|nr:DUF4838 domain-containing protein [Bacilli bacterium]
MKKKLIKIIGVFFVTSTLLVGCKKKNKEVEKEEQKAEIIEDKYIVRNSRTEYNIVIPKNANTKIRTAANDLSTYISKASGARISVILENEVLKGNKYISLGNTTQFKEQFSSYTFEKLDKKISSYFISTKDENIYIYSNPNERGEGVLYGSWDLLHELIGYEFYTEDEIYYKNETTINLRGYKDFFIEPTFDGRSIGNYFLNHNQSTCDNYRILNQYNGKEWVSEIYGHGQVVTFVRPQDLYDGVRTNFEAHPEWFTNKTATHANTTNNQLCWSAGESLEDYVYKRFIHFFEKYPDATYFMFGQEDNSDCFCHCEKCEKAMREYAVNLAGLQIIFMNHVIAKTEAWLKENQPGRHVRYVVFAYYATKTAPCVQKEGKWVLPNDLVKPHENLYILYAPITCNFAYPLDNNYFNNDTLLQLKQWNEVAAGHVMVYFYDTNFKYYFSNFYNFGTVKSMYKTCKELGASYMYTQGATDTITGCFSNMREYVESKLMWNIDLSYEDLVKDFIDHYYYEAAPYIYEYYQTIRDRLVAYHTSKGDGGAIYANISNKELYPYSVLRYYTSLIYQAMEKIDHYQATDLDFYLKLKSRIMKEYLSVIYLKMTLTKAEVSESDKEEMKEIFSYYIGYFGIATSVEGGSLIDIDALFA